MFLYYRFLGSFGREPRDFEDFFDGMRAKNAMSEIEALPWKK